MTRQRSPLASQLAVAAPGTFRGIITVSTIAGAVTIGRVGMAVGLCVSVISMLIVAAVIVLLIVVFAHLAGRVTN